MTNNWNYGDSYFNGDSYKTRAQAFAAARKNGNGIFTYKGKQYNTMQKGDNADEFRRAHADYDYFLGNVAKDQGGWKPSDPVQTSYKVNNVPDVYTKPLPKSSKPQPPARTKLSMFTNDDIRNLGFRNYAGMVSAIGNKANANNNFVKAMIDRYGSDTNKWDQNTIENDLGVKGTYRSFGRGDFGDMSRAMAGWIGQNNGEIDKQDLQSRTGSDGVVYANSKVKDLFDKVQLKPKTFTFNVNLLGTPKKQQGGQLNMDEQLQQEFLQYLMQKTGAQNKQQLEQEIQQLGEDGLRREYAKFIQELQQQQVQVAMNGAKLNYINKLMVNVLREHIYHIIEQEELYVKSVKLMLTMKVLILLKLLNRNVEVRLKKLLNRSVEARLKRKNQVVKQIIRKISLNLNQLKNLRIKLFLRNLRILDQDQKI